MTTQEPTSAQIEHFIKALVDDIHIRGKLLEDAKTNLLNIMGNDPVLSKAIDLAASQIQSKINSIEVLGEPASIKLRGRIKWYTGPNDNNIFWPALKNYLTYEKNWDETTVKSIDTSSTKVISCLDFPGKPEFKTKGLVIGYVQSGKTANFTAVISKAADVGFSLFIILSGMTNSLRSQTQERLDDELIARHPEKWLTWTDLNSDIGDLPFDVNALLDSDRRHIAVVKKNGPRMRRLLKMIKNTNDNIKKRCKVIIIDDESDQASVNSASVRGNASAINRLLRDIITELPRVCYIGYTATPYANMLIAPDINDDIYPSDFIISLPRPDNYFGAERLFGRDMLFADEFAPDEQGLDMIRHIPDEEIKHLRPQRQVDIYNFTPDITDSLEKAILYYILATAAKITRGLENQHSCMLIHTSVNTAVHLSFKPLITSYLNDLLDKIKNERKSIFAQLEELWSEECSAIDPSQFGLEHVSFEKIKPLLVDTINSIEICVENAVSDKRLNFTNSGRRYIVIGGNVLARGLTIEGLITSFFLRTSSQYDSLMQMGRWFGYKNKYEDLPRAWMTSEMMGYFHDMATVEAEIRNDIETYERENLTPAEFAVRIRQHPVLAVTARNKMLAAINCKVSFSNRHLQTRKFNRLDINWLQNNWNAGATLVDNMINDSLTSESSTQHHIFRNVPVTHVIRFLENYRIHEAHQDINTGRLIQYINEQNNRDNNILDEWNIVIVGSSRGAESNRPLGKIGRIKTSIRARLKESASDEIADIKALMSRSDITIDCDWSFDASMKWFELKNNRKNSNMPPLLLLYPIDSISAPATEKNRLPLDAKHDVLGLALLFPESRIDTPIGYISARVDSSSFEDAEFAEEVINE